jgi:hypothetical protein
MMNLYIYLLKPALQVYNYSIFPVYVLYMIFSLSKVRRPLQSARRDPISGSDAPYGLTMSNQEEVLQSSEQIPENTTIFAEAFKGWLNTFGWDEIYILNKFIDRMLTVGN